MKYSDRLILLSLFVTSLFSCVEQMSYTTIAVTNNLDVPRQFETVSLTKDFLEVDNLSTLGIRDQETKQVMVTQAMDNDGDGTMDELLFQPELAANSERVFEIISLEGTEKPQTEIHCYSRFVPERTDDYAWENNRVAFRTYGPTAQKMTEDGIAGGTLSSGIDAWLKKVEYPIINKWYKKELETGGTYHEDNGEGLDNFHVGVSRGVGGTAVKVDSTYHFSKNFTHWKTLSTGPIRTSFVLTYDNWEAEGNTIAEEKYISLDYGSNLAKFEVHVKGTDTLSVGLTLHEIDGVVTLNPEQGYVSYWQPHKDSELGTAIVASKGTMIGSEKYITDKIDRSNAYAQLKVEEGTVVYYAGFGWKESEQFQNRQEWEAYLTLFAKKINNSIAVALIN